MTHRFFAIILLWSTTCCLALLDDYPWLIFQNNTPFPLTCNMVISYPQDKNVLFHSNTINPEISMSLSSNDEKNIISIEYSIAPKQEITLHPMTFIDGKVYTPTIEYCQCIVHYTQIEQLFSLQNTDKRYFIVNFDTNQGLILIGKDISLAKKVKQTLINAILYYTTKIQTMLT